MASIAILTSFASIFLPTYSGVRPTIRPATKTAMMTKSSMPYRPAPTPPTMISPSCDDDQRNHAAERGEAVMHGIDGSRRRRRWSTIANSARIGHDAEADFLAFHVAAGRGRAPLKYVVAVRFGPVANEA